MRFGGFMGIGEDYYPLPWSLLAYDPRLEGYEVNISDQQLKGAPKYSKHENWDWSDRARGEQVFDYYGVGPYWGSYNPGPSNLGGKLRRHHPPTFRGRCAASSKPMQ